MKNIGNKNFVKHGLSKTRIHRIWHSMYCRCYYKTTNGYNRYGGRGITICEEWKHLEGFINFYNWAMENGYKENLTLDRIDVNGNYEPNNCRWIALEEQYKNMTINKFFMYEGKKYTQNELCRKFNIIPTTFCDRLKRGWTLEQALTISTKGKHRKVVK